MVEGTLYDTDALNELAKIPSRDELISKLLGSLQSPITKPGTRSQSDRRKKVEQMLVKQLRQQKEAAEAPAAE